MVIRRATGTAAQTMLLAIALAACATRELSQYPVLEPVLAADAQRDCASLDDEILKANAIRDAIYDEHGDVISGAVAGSALEIAMDPLTGSVTSLLGATATSKASKRYMRAAGASEARMQKLLENKQAKSCPSGPSAKAGLSDELMLERLQHQEQSLANKTISRGQFLRARRELFDDLR